MNAKEAFKSAVNFSSMVVKTYVSDLSDQDLLVRPAEGCNHLAWQLGHLISSEVGLLAAVTGRKLVELPAGFDEAHAKDKANVDDPAAFLSKAAYVEWFDKVRAASLAALEAFSDADFDRPAPERLQRICPTMGDAFTLIATHPMMHAGQFVIVRRKLGKPVLI
jgi:hypothetical protein